MKVLVNPWGKNKIQDLCHKRRFAYVLPFGCIRTKVPIAFKTKSSYELVFINLAASHESNKMFPLTNVR